jgi:hypothetical protein
MEKISDLNVDLSINRVLAMLSPSSGISDLYPNQRKMLHYFCQGQDIFLTGSKCIPITSTKM